MTMQSGRLYPFRLFVSPSGEERLAAARRFVEEAGPGTEVLIVGATRDAADEFVRSIAVDREATFGLHRMSLSQLAALLTIETLARVGLAPATRLGAEAVAARVAFDAQAEGLIPRLAPVCRFPGFPRALAATLNELRTAGGLSLGRKPKRSSGGDALPSVEGEIRLLFERYQIALRDTHLADHADLLQLARRSWKRSRFAHLREAPLLLLDVPLPSWDERNLFTTLLAPTRPTLVTFPEGDDATRDYLMENGGALERGGDENGATRQRSRRGGVGSATARTLDRLRVHLFADRALETAETDDSVAFFSAPGEGRECVEIARRILDEARRGVPFDEMAVFLRAPEVYGSLLEAALRRAGVPAFFARGTRRPDPAGRAFLALLDCRAERLSARRFAEYLSFAQVPLPNERGEPPEDRDAWAAPRDELSGPGAAAVQLALFEQTADEPAVGEGKVAGGQRGGPDGEPEDHQDRPRLGGALRAPWRWEEFLVEASVIGERARWRRRLAGLEAEWRHRRDALARDEPGSPRIAALERDLRDLGHLQRFALPLIERLDALPAEAPWGIWLDALRSLAPRALRSPERVLAVLAELEPMSRIGPVAMEEVREVLADRLATLERDPPEQRYGRVFVASPADARGRTFRVAFAPGLAEHLFPQRPREDPLLPDAQRGVMNPFLRRQEDRGRDERLALRLVAGAARERLVLSYPRVDVAQGRPRVPSFYGLDVARATRGVLPDPEALEREAARAGDARLAWPAPSDPDRAVDAVEHDLAVLEPLLRELQSGEVAGRARYLLELNEHLAASLRTRWLRARNAWSSADGLMRPSPECEPALAAHRLNERVYSVTALEQFAACPYRFLLGAIHHLEPRREKNAIVQLDPLTRGQLIHVILADTFRAWEEAELLPVVEARITDAETILTGVVDRVAERFRDELAPAIERVWRDEIGRLRTDLRLWLRQLAREGETWRPRYVEFAFGLRDRESRDAASVPQPVSLPGGWKLRGAVDLVEERIADGALRVTDHKTGRNRIPPRQHFVTGGGETLQPLLYALAVEFVLDQRAAEARLSFPTSLGGFSQVHIHLDDPARFHALTILERIDAAVASGALPRAPRQDACHYCDFRPACEPDAETRAQRKTREDALLRPLRDIRELP